MASEHEEAAGVVRPAAPNEPTVRGNLVRALRSAAVDLWSAEVLNEIGVQLPADARASTVSSLFILSDTIFPERYVLQWLHAVWQGPCRRDHATLRIFMGRVCEWGFARTQRLLLRMSSPAQLVERAPAIWNSQHSHGKLTMQISGDSQVRVRLERHPYVSSPLSRVAIGEFYRYAVSLCRGVTVADEYNNHLTDDGAFGVDIRWR